MTTQRITAKILQNYLRALNIESGINFSYSHWNGNTYQLEIDGQPIGRVSIGRGQFYDVVKALVDTFDRIKRDSQSLEESDTGLGLEINSPR